VLDIYGTVLIHVGLYCGQDSMSSETGSCEISYSEDVRRLLGGGQVMSPSLQVNKPHTFIY
jgi:hypothetical protein